MPTRSLRSLFFRFARNERGAASAPAIRDSARRALYMADTVYGRLAGDPSRRLPLPTGWTASLRVRTETVTVALDGRGLTVDTLGEPAPVVPVNLGRIRGVDAVGRAARSLLGETCDAVNLEDAPRPGDLVRIRPSASLADPWRTCAEIGLAMRVRAIDPRRPSKCVSVQPAATDSRTLRYEWFRPEDLEPYAERSSDTSGADLRERLIARFATPAEG